MLASERTSGTMETGTHAEIGFWKDLGSTLEQFVTDQLYPIEGTHKGAVNEELQTVVGIQCWSWEKCDFDLIS